MDRKNADYAARGANVLGNLTMCEELSHGDVTTEQGIVLRMGDKLARAWTPSKGEGAVKGEPLHDVCLDLINYATLLLVAHEQRETTRLCEEATERSKLIEQCPGLTTIKTRDSKIIGALTPRQLEVYRSELSRNIEAKEAYRRAKGSSE